MIFKKEIIFILFSLVFISKTNWAQTNEPPVINAIGDQSYCPGEKIKIATGITIVDIDDTEVEAMYIQISAGYKKNQDQLTLVEHTLIMRTPLLPLFITINPVFT